MEQASDTFWDAYRTIVSRLMRPIGKTDGYSEARVAEAERQIGFPLPRLLREVYLLTGRREDIHAAHDRLVPPEDISFQDDALVFYEENQAACLWGIRTTDIGHDDPAVLRQDSTANPTWEPHNDRLSEFLTAMLFWQAVNGGMRHAGVGTASSAKIAQAEPDWENVILGGSWDSRALMRDGEVLLVFGNESPPEVHGGARTKRKMLSLEKTFDIAWDYCTLDDE